MIRLLHVLSGLAILLAGGVFALCARQWRHDDPTHEALLGRPGAVGIFLQSTHGTPGDDKERVSPLLAEATAFAAYLNPPASVKALVATEAPKPAPVVRPPTASPKFKVCGTSCCDDQPDRSMVLILEPGTTNTARWVRRGTQVGHLVIQEIRPGSIVYLDGTQVREMAIERETTTAAVAVESSHATDASPPVAAQTETVRLPASAKRPARGKSMTVGSARTAALD
jgi:hypothetical protein